MLARKQDILKSKFNPLTRLSIYIIRDIYQGHLRARVAYFRLKKGQMTICSFFPSCSEYSIIALEKYGFIRGWHKALVRISRCKTFVHDESCVDYP
jgi:putative component of membrane protein insertase Oxa1/YidC/SpoIIIJ protein YidD